jgi:hypothetical protein
VIGNIETPIRVWISGALMREPTTMWSHTMANSRILAMAAFLSAAIITPALAAGYETATRPWSAPVGHRQPRAADIPASASQQILDQEGAIVDRKISNICRGC